MVNKKTTYCLYALFILVLIGYIGSWNKLRYKQQEWQNVPPAPTSTATNLTFLSDKQFAYRTYALQIQNFGDTGGRTSVFKDYNYNRLSDWFMFMDSLDNKSAHVPFLSAYYYSATKEEDQLRILLDYLEYAGQRPYGEHWRWLVQAVFIAKTTLKDYDRAKQLAETLARVYRPEDMPAYTLQMPAFIEADMGDKEAAYAILMSILKSSVSHMHPSEVYFMKDYICNRILEGIERDENPLCQDL